METALNGGGSAIILKGTQHTIRRVMEAFKEGVPYVPTTTTRRLAAEAPPATSSTLPLRVLMLNSQHYGAGLNLEFATHVITLHAISTEQYSQVVGRAQRRGRTSALQVLDIRSVGSPVCVSPEVSAQYGREFMIQNVLV